MNRKKFPFPHFVKMLSEYFVVQVMGAILVILVEVYSLV
jgi:hypothetical protein